MQGPRFPGPLPDRRRPGHDRLAAQESPEVCVLIGCRMVGEFDPSELATPLLPGLAPGVLDEDRRQTSAASAKKWSR